MNEHNKVLIGQWMSIIDKILAKPKVAKKSGKSVNPSKKQYELRDALGNECWDILTRRPIFKLDENDFVRKNEIDALRVIWERRLHPYGDKVRVEANGNFEKEVKVTIKGRWYVAFLKARDFDVIDHTELAEKIKEHLHTHEVKINGKLRKEPEGLIDHRATSISSNSLSRHFENKSSQTDVDTSSYISQTDWDKEDEITLNSAGGLAAQIYKENLDQEKLSHPKAPNKRTLRPAEAGKLIFKHYGKLFADEGGEVPKREVLIQSHSGLLSLYDTIRNYYKTLLKTHRKPTLTTVLSPSKLGYMFDLNATK